MGLSGKGKILIGLRSERIFKKIGKRDRMGVLADFSWKVRVH